ncbi:hypothetical protein HZH68_006557 [Vespula germanica]|uniref:Uncharacterized protein n=1 Tax=Vespula germanica TaxID=30212 RepID=A0A834KBQ2_VESGE|nr:hypothetical protein HZH68_006557 [Vespula germanica]
MVLLGGSPLILPCSAPGGFQCPLNYLSSWNAAGVKFRRECAVIKKGVAPIHRSHLPENCLEMGRRKDVTGDGATLLPEDDDDDDDDEDAVVEEDGVSIIKWFIFLRSAKSALIA